MNERILSNKQGRGDDLYDSANEHGACGVGFLVNFNGRKSHRLVEDAVKVLENLKHRGASLADNKTGDGAGILFQIPDKFFRGLESELGFTLPEPRRYGVAMVFLPADEGVFGRCRKLFDETVDDEGLDVLGWREVPTVPSALGRIALAGMPRIMQCFVSGGEELEGDALERKLFVARKRIENRVRAEVPGSDDFHIPGFSANTITYKGLMMGAQISEFYVDLRDPSFESALAVVHQRYSTNTFPSWRLAQPFRFLAHNGEINTLRANLNQMRARERLLESELFKEDTKKLLPVIEPDGSDSSSLDNVLELLVLGGRDPAHSMMMLIPQAWGEKYPIGPDLRGFYEYHAGLMEPWDGPAAVAFSNGR
ncbi:MAG: glutamate synthase subunit alpha, partial [Verrucomicrobia bacterium]|nr:glutamate synthase subunit alpha [Verrucomicrobiota bacterium]